MKCGTCKGRGIIVVGGYALVEGKKSRYVSRSCRTCPTCHGAGKAPSSLKTGKELEVQDEQQERKGRNEATAERECIIGNANGLLLHACHGYR